VQQRPRQAVQWRGACSARVKEQAAIQRYQSSRGVFYHGAGLGQIMSGHVRGGDRGEDEGRDSLYRGTSKRFLTLAMGMAVSTREPDFD